LPGVVLLDPLDGLGDGDAADAAIVVAYSAAPPIPPTSIDPAAVAATANFRTPFSILCLLCFDRPTAGVAT
jgi:hypothetical protein